MWELSNIDASGLVGPWYHDLRIDLVSYPSGLCLWSPWFHDFMDDEPFTSAVLAVTTVVHFF